MRRLLLILPCLLMLSCQPENCNTPFGAGGTIDLIDYSNLYNHVGGTEMISCGYKGVLVRCSGFSEYTAFECACPHDHEMRMLPDDSKEAVILTCPSCGSRFELINGAPLEGSATSCQLYQYRVSVEGTMLTIY